MAILFKNGKSIEIKPAGRKFTAPELRNVIGNFFQKVWGAKHVFVVDEEGKLKELDPNPLPTYMAVKEEAIYPDDTLNGPVLVCNLNEI